jgi:hypothetical protein
MSMYFCNFQQQQYVFLTIIKHIIPDENSKKIHTYAIQICKIHIN